ncbi:MAG: hypothetical protein RML93_01155 [Anaerolineales bacterium]|nr:hypothetical protein [Anaerolineales bacterium]MCS7249161.1 hypothetical protein [Anaerolineales bacterium]MDW8162974.1 hypothetical protein [Anaerolineales bacterium]MDW8445879.1 hypothetical protein [Anaerolineales bacterium]
MPELVPFKVAQSTRGYEPLLLTHYQASWISGADQWPVPTWPILVDINQYLHGDGKSEFKSPLTLKGSFPNGAQLSIRVQQVSDYAELSVRANGRTVYRKVFKPGPGQGEWKKSIYRPEWNNYLGVYDKEYTVALPNGTAEIQFEVVRGDWLTFSEICIKPFPGIGSNEPVIRATDSEWGIPHNRQF